MKKLFLLGLLLVSVLALWDGINPESFAENDDEIDVYLLEGVISMFRKYEKLMEKLHVFHGGIGFVNTRTDEHIQCEYYALDFFGAIRPYVDKEAVTAVFNNTAICVCQTPWHDHWSKGATTKVATTDGSIFSPFYKWMEEYNVTKGEYFLWNVDEKVHGTEWIHGNTCFDFVSRGFQNLFENGVNFDISKVYKSEDAYFYSGKPVLVDYGDYETRKKIVNFYDTFNLTDSSTIEEIFEIILLFPEGKFVYSNGNYYLLDLHFPYIEPHYRKRDLPGQ